MTISPHFALNRVTYLSCIAVFFTLFLSQISHAELTLLSQFDPPEGGEINAIAYDSSSSDIFLHYSSNAAIHRYQSDGTFLGAVTVGPPSDQGNDSDLEIADEAININGTIVPANSLLIIENDTDPPQIIAADKDSGAVLASQDFDGSLVGSWVGAAWSNNLDAFFAVSWSTDEINRVDASNGTIETTFDVSPAGSPVFDVFFGDIEVRGSNGHLYIVTDRGAPRIRELTPNGAFIRDIPLPPGVDHLSGIAFDDVADEAWVSSTDGEVFRLGGFNTVPEPASCTLAMLGIGILCLFHRKRK